MSGSDVASLSNAQASVDAMAATDVKGDAAKAGGYPSGETNDEQYGQDVVYPVKHIE